jgi:hypothetical protein
MKQPTNKTHQQTNKQSTNKQSTNKQKNKNGILSIDSDDDDSDYKSFNEFTTSHTKRQKNQFVNEIELNGDRYTKEIDRKKKEKNAVKLKPIKYILKHSKSYDKEELISYDLVDVLIIEKEIKESKNSVMKKLFNFFGTQTN